jgi:hypothetical protein
MLLSLYKINAIFNYRFIMVSYSTTCKNVELWGYTLSFICTLIFFFTSYS